MSKLKIFIDAGHGGKDPGAVANGVKEKDLNLEASKYISNELRRSGFDVITTRTSDVSIDNNVRVNKIKNSGVERCISLHFNAGGGEGAEFIHSIYSKGELEKILEKEFKNSGQSTRRIFSRKNSRGTDYYYMHRLTGSVTTTIVEFAFLDNSKDFEKINTRSKREKLYDAVVKAICDYYKVDVKKKKTSKGSESGVYEVKRGDTLWGISRKYNMSVSDLKNINNLISDVIVPGQKLKVEVDKVKLDLNAPSGNPLLRRGSRNVRVRKLQEDLNKLGFNSGKVDGIFGQKTEKALKDFQKKYGLSVDGLYGNKSASKLRSLR